MADLRDGDRSATPRVFASLDHVMRPLAAVSNKDQLVMPAVGGRIITRSGLV